MPGNNHVEMKDHQLICHGEWNVNHIMKLEHAFKKIKWPTGGQIDLNGKEIKKFDSAGAWLILKWQYHLEKKGLTVQLHDFPDTAQALITLIKKQNISFEKKIPQKRYGVYSFEGIGKYVINLIKLQYDYMNFIGRVFLESLRIFKNPKLFRFVSLVNQIDITGFGALPVIALLSCMVGIVLAYQMGIQLRNYGANIYVVDLIGLSMMREFGPLLTAIMVAGRTGSAFTAELGMMKITQEIDALRTMGITPEVLLLVPRITSLLITLPLLTVWSDIFGILGGMVMANNMFDITSYDFLYRLQMQIPLKTLIIGIGKTPIFALIIASTGCFQGMQVLGNADSLGKNTTRSVVLSIFFIIVADALFSVIFSQFKL